MTFRTRDLRNAFTTIPPLVALVGGKIARRDRILASFAQADRQLGNGRRVVARVGLHGGAAWQVPNTSPETKTQTHPLATDLRTVCRTPYFAVTPGHFLVVSALVAPSGQTQRYVAEPGSWIRDIAGGRIYITVDWVGAGGTDTTTSTLLLPLPSSPDGIEPETPGRSWVDLRRVQTAIIAPENAATNNGDLRDWCNGTTARVTIEYRGGARVVDLAVMETPLGYARELSVDAQPYATTLSTNGAGQVIGTYPAQYPLDAFSATDATLGAPLLADVVDRQACTLGPMLAHWTAFSEATTAVTATDVPTISTSSTSFVGLASEGLSGWRATLPGWSLAAGGHAQQFLSSNALRELRDEDACVPVRCWVYGHVIGGGSGVVRWQSEHFSLAEVTLTGSTPAWYSITGHLRCGVGPEDSSVLVLFGKAAGGGTLHVSGTALEYLDL